MCFPLRLGEALSGLVAHRGQHADVEDVPHAVLRAALHHLEAGGTWALAIARLEKTNPVDGYSKARKYKMVHIKSKITTQNMVSVFFVLYYLNNL